MKSHNVDQILNFEQSQSKKKQDRKRKRNNSETKSEGDLEESNQKQNSETQKAAHTKILRTEGHRAGYDAFMTGFCFACNVLHFGKLEDCESSQTSGPTSQSNGNNLTFKSFNITTEFGNNIFLSGKDIPLKLCKSGFAKTSQGHRKKWSLLNKSIDK